MSVSFSQKFVHFWVKTEKEKGAFNKINMSVSFSQKFVYFWVKTEKEKGAFTITLNRDGSTTNPTVSG